MTKGLLGCVALLVVGALVLGMVAYGQYNGLVGAEEAVRGQWSQVENVYQRRADLVPNLVNTVKGSAAFEQETLREVVEARSRVGQVTTQAGSDVLNDPARFRQFAEAQDQLSSALSRLLVVVERYPDLRTTAAFRDLMVQLEGTENRISVERRRFNELARDYNVRLRRIPAAWFAKVLGWGFEQVPYFEAQAGAAQAPTVQF
jgi:LemA protein